MLMGPQNLPERLAEVRERIKSAALDAGRPVDSITLLGITKGQPASLLHTAVQAGMREFGESYLQEALDKMATLAKLRAQVEPSQQTAADDRAAREGIPSGDTGITWHFVGRLQSNKTRPVAEGFAWVHAVDRLKIAERLSEQRPYYAPPLNVCLQVNVGGEDSKGGVSLSELPALATRVATLPRLKLRGLMCLPPEESDPIRQRHWFGLLREALERLNASGLAMDTLSMGMSADLEAAIHAGSTIVRVGTALFGPRETAQPAP
jgi:pyridoxal phosphate enzyme (YggS family)